MSNPQSVSHTFSGTDKTVSFETGRLAGLAGGAVLAQLGDTTVLVTATGAKSPRPGADFFPLTVDIEERMYAAGKIPGSFFRREGRAPESAILTCRLIDRPLRPMFPDGYRNEVHIVGTVMGADMENPYDVLALNAASAALMLSGIPFDGPIGATRIAWSAAGEWIAHPTYEEGADSAFEMVVAGRINADGDVAVMMVEAGGTAATWDVYEAGAPKVDEAVLADGLEFSKQYIREVIELQHELVALVGAPEQMSYTVTTDYSDEVLAAVDAAGRERIAESQTIADKTERGEAEANVKAALFEELAPQFADVDGAEQQIKGAIRSITKAVVRERVISEGMRIDGRGPGDLRSLSSDVGVIPTAHGSGLFQRGETQVLNFTTLGTGRMDQMIDGIDPIIRKRYMHHYNFPPFSTGETGFMRGPKRREIGHGALAERALFPVVPSFEEFPYTLRLVSEVLSSNGSTSMASVCSSSLSMMDAGVPIKAPVAGIAMGLVYHEGQYVTLTDILGVEDAFGDMDFKVAGTSEFVTALQLDTKIDGIPADVLANALSQAKEARLAILDVMAGAIAEPRPEVGEHAPKIKSFEIPVEKIGEVIGPKGKMINTIQAETGADISIDDDGMVGIVSIASPDIAKVEEATRQIMLIVDPPTAEVGALYTGKVVNITKFGAFVNILPGRDGLVHISKLGGGKRIDKVEDVLELGQEIEVVVEDVDPNGKISLKPVGGASQREKPIAEKAEATPAERDEAPSDEAPSDEVPSDEVPSDEAPSDEVPSDEAPVVETNDSDDAGDDTLVVEASFEDAFASELEAVHGELGNAAPAHRGGGGGGGGGRRRGR
ncbi:MAG: polyribonucleotide nucleotidyltransferase [Acidimicrobiales bacterium]|nr:polyribonucleotide nucleotidyltransferase [Acidimicrobiales bacterium]